MNNERDFIKQYIEDTLLLTVGGQISIKDNGRDGIEVRFNNKFTGLVIQYHSFVFWLERVVSKKRGITNTMKIQKIEGKKVEWETVSTNKLLEMFLWSTYSVNQKQGHRCRLTINSDGKMCVIIDDTASGLKPSWRTYIAWLMKEYNLETN